MSKPKYFTSGEVTTGILNAESEQRLKEMLGENADQLLKHYGDRAPQAFEATFTDGDGHVYKGTLYLVADEGKPNER